MLELAHPKPYPTCAPCPQLEPRWSLWVAIAGSTMVFVDGSIVNVALPVIQRELDESVSTMQWIVEAYALMLASLVLVGGASEIATGAVACSASASRYSRSHPRVAVSHPLRSCS